MTAFRIVLLAVGVAGATLRPWRLPAWLAPVLAAGIVVTAGGFSPSMARHALRPLVGPVAFLLAAVPLAVLLDHLGFFAHLAERLTRRGGGSGRLWVLAALVTTTLSLDAAVVLLTPLYVRIARRTGRDPVVLAFQPVLLASLASSALPVSNLTNLIAASWTGASTLDFVSHLAVPSLVASIIGWYGYRRYLKPDGPPAGAPGPNRSPTAAPLPDGSATAAPLPDGSPTAAPLSDGPPAGAPGPDGLPTAAPLPDGPPTATPADAPGRRGGDRALLVGEIVVTLVVIGFLVGRSIGIPLWAVAAAADVVLVITLRELPWRAIPWATGLIVAALGVLAAAAVADISIGGVISGHGTLALARTAGLSGLAANVINNLPALLIALPTLGHHVSPSLWAVLAGVNFGPVLLVTGSLASLLWLDAMGRLGVTVSARDFTRVGWRVGLPAAIAGGIVTVALLRPW